MSETDLQLLTRYASQRAEDAFAEIVRRHVDLVHSAALRQVRSQELAEEVAQAVFVELARQARELPSRTVLAAWLYHVTRRRAIDVVRREAGRRLREQTAQELQAMNATAEDWTHIEPLLDDAMDALEETDRLAVLLRYFQNKPLREVGQVMGVTDDAAQKRVSRAVERLREFFAKRGVTVGASGLFVIISANAVQAAPVGLAVTISTISALAGNSINANVTTAKSIVMTTTHKVLAIVILFAAIGTGIFAARQGSTAGDASSSQVFVGSSPCGERMRTLFQIPAGDIDPLKWTLTLRHDPKTLAPTGYKLECSYISASELDGTEKQIMTVIREGTWSLSKRTESKPDAVVYELENAFALLKVDDNLLHILETDRSLMVGSAGYSYTLNRKEAAEEPGNLALAIARPSVSYTNLPLAQGPVVFGIFEGRSPARGMMRQFRQIDDSSSIKAKWRITLFQNPQTQAPTTYRAEGSLYRGHAREGKWSIIRGAGGDPNAVIYSLDAIETEPRIFLLKGDDNVLFFLNQNRQPMVGHADFSYTLNRRIIAP